MIDQYVAFTDNVGKCLSKRSCRRFVKNQGWWDTVANNYSNERFKYTFRMSRKMFNYILEDIRGGLQNQIVTELPISQEMWLAICLYKLTREDCHCTIAKMAGIAQFTVCRINKKTLYFLKWKFLSIWFQIKVIIPWKNLKKFELHSVQKQLYKSMPSFTEFSN